MVADSFLRLGHGRVCVGGSGAVLAVLLARRGGGVCARVLCASSALGARDRSLALRLRATGRWGVAPPASCATLLCLRGVCVAAVSPFVFSCRLPSWSR